MDECLDIDKLDPTIFNDVCIASDLLHNETAWSLTQDAMKTCCGPKNFFVTNDDCYTYCNITTPLDTTMMSNCLSDTLDQDTLFQLQFDCYPFAWELSSTMDTTPGLIATTWSYPDQTFTFTDTLSNGAVTTRTETDNYWGTPLTAITTSAKTSPTATGSTATKTTGTGSSSTTASPTTSTKSSGAGSGRRVSYGAAALAALSVARFLL